MARAEQEIRQEIYKLVREYYEVKFACQEFTSGKDDVCYAGRVFDHREIERLVESSLDFWLTAGRFSRAFELEFAKYVNIDYAILTNSGSSANLLALSSLTSHLLGDKCLKAENQVIAVATGFPTTVNPIIQNNMVPVFVDIEVGTYNAQVEQIEKAIGPKTRAIFLAHTLGNPYNLDAVMKLVEKHDLFLVEDCCDALGSTYDGKHVGTFGHVATCSFYPAHHMTIGEGGVVFTKDPRISRAVTSIRDWGRDCYCKSGENNTCGKRFSGQYGKLPFGYDHKYVYSHIGYNLKVTDMQAAIGIEQLKKLPSFVARRKENFQAWMEGFMPWEDLFILPKPMAKSDPSWFAFPVSVREGVGFTRTELTKYLAENRVETRNVFAGNLLKQPAYLDIQKRVIGELRNTDFVMNNTFFLGTYPGITPKKIQYTLDMIRTFLVERKT